MQPLSHGTLDVPGGSRPVPNPSHIRARDGGSLGPRVGTGYNFQPAGVLARAADSSCVGEHARPKASGNV